MTYRFEVVDVFSSHRFGGNPLAVFPEAAGLDAPTMQALAAELNLSEATFVLPPADAANTARVRIFNRKAEMDFAGHPMIGTAFVLALRDARTAMAFEVPAGQVHVTVRRDEVGRPTACRIEAPQPLQIGNNVPAFTVAACLELSEEDVVRVRHEPVFASMGNPYVVAEVTDTALRRAMPNLQAFRIALADNPNPCSRFSLYIYVRSDNELRARMFAPLSGTFEDPATGSAAAPLAGLILCLTDQERAAFPIVQGSEMGRPSLIAAEAWRGARGICASVEGACVPVFIGQFDL